LIHNPTAGDEKQPSAGQLEALIKEAGYKLRYQSAKEQGWQKALKRPADIIAVAGGDGTVTKVARRLIGTGLPIAVLPMGTANNISRTLGIFDVPVTTLIPAWDNAYRLNFDAGLATGPWGERHFIEGCGAGLLTTAIPKVDASKTIEQLPQTQVKVSYAQQLTREHLAETRPIEIQATLDGEDVSGRYLLIEVMNMQYIGPNLFLAPQLVRNDGEFELVLVQERHRKELGDHIRQWQEGKLFPPELETRRGRKLEINWTGFRLHIDDKLWPPIGKRKPKSPAPIELRVAPEAVTFLIPPDVHEMQEAARQNARKAAGDGQDA
jgi:diacylglycerol kinase family enzyme